MVSIQLKRYGLLRCFRKRKREVIVLGALCSFVISAWRWQLPQTDGEALALLAATTADTNSDKDRQSKVLLQNTTTTPERIRSTAAISTRKTNNDESISSQLPVENHHSQAAPHQNKYNELALIPIQRSHHNLPDWMVDYFEWHRKQRAELTPDNWNDKDKFKFLIMRCLNQDKICGGTSDRLSSLPFQLLMAHLNQRILLIYWERPFPLEEFLLPPVGGLDWRVPSFMVDHLLQQKGALLTFAPSAAKILAHKQDLIVWSRDQTHNHGKSVYDQHHERIQHSSRFEEVFHDAWRIVLTPAPPVARQIERWMQTLGLVPGQYASTHVRALYGVHDRPQEQIVEWTTNAIRCTTQLQPKGPFFVASDSTVAQKAALEYGKDHDLTVVSRFHETEPLHLEANSTGKVPAQYYDIFVDLYLLGNARAVAYNVGGYGKLGLILGFDYQAGIQHQRGGVPWKGGVTGVKLHECALKRPDKGATAAAAPHTDHFGSFFAPPVMSAS